MIRILARVERANVVFGVLLTALAGLVWGRPGVLGTGAGALLACVNFFVLRRLGARAASSVLAGAAPRGFGFILIGKMTALFASVFVAIRVLHLPVIPFALGFSVFVASILLVGVSSVGKPELEA
jgi:hypothetical protein